jgi:hypothetical protein
METAVQAICKDIACRISVRYHLQGIQEREIQKSNVSLSGLSFAIADTLIKLTRMNAIRQ